MLTLKKLKVRGFRGFLFDEELDLASPATILFGENHCCKSSALNAVEWSLFGDQCLGKQTNIRERIGWLIPNRHQKTPEVLVEIQLDSPEGGWVIRRSIKKSGKKAAGAGLELTLPDGEVLSGEGAEQRLAQLHRSSFRDFMTTVYQHQEAIRAVLTQEPRERNDAIDRLLGLSDYRNLLTGINDANLRGRQKDIGKTFDGFENRVKDALKGREAELETKRQEALKAGIAKNLLNGKGALLLAGQLQQALKEFSEEAGVEFSIREVPQGWKQVPDFEKWVKTTINWLRGELPDAKEQAELFIRRTALAGLTAEYGNAKENQAAVGNSIRDLDKEHLGQHAVASRIADVDKEIKAAKASLRETNARAALIKETIGYLEKVEARESEDHCPVCGNEAPNLLESLRLQWEETLQTQVTTMGERINALQGHLQQLQKVEDKYKEWDGKLALHVQKLTDCRQGIGQLLGKELTDKEDMLALLNKEQKTIEHRLGKLKEAVRKKQERLSGIEEVLEKVRIIREILQSEEKKKIIEQIQESSEYQQLESFRDRIAEMAADVESIKEAITATAHEQARDKLGAAECTIDGYFRKLTRHPAVKRIRLTLSADARTGRNSYDLTDQDAKDLTPVMSQGDLNALALAIFLGLASSNKNAGPFGFVMLDDPSQSLGSEHKEQLVKVLNEVVGPKQVLLATMDREFRDCLRDGLTHSKTEYWFAAWTPENGPSIERR